MKPIVVIGAGYVGLVTGVCFARNNHVIIVEKDPQKIEELQLGRVPFFEPGLAEELSVALKNKKLVITSSLSYATSFKPEVIFICVGTPSLDDGSVDLTAVKKVADELASCIVADCLIVTKSTVPVGTTRSLYTFFQEQFSEKNITIEMASNPEFLREGNALGDFLHPDRVVVGTTSQQAAALLRLLYMPFLTTHDNFLCMNIESAELTKYAANAMLATRISFVNEIARLADAMNADVAEVIEALGRDSRIGKAFLNPGVGYGGSCLPKDVKALISYGKKNKMHLSLIPAVDAINTEQQKLFFSTIASYYKGNLKGKRLGVWGLSFKPHTDDLRDAPSLVLLKKLIEQQAHIMVYDPVSIKGVQKLFGSALSYAHNKEEVLLQSDALILLTEWPEFLATPYSAFASLGDKIIFDGRTCLTAARMIEHGLTYRAMGRQMQKTV